MYSIEKEFCFEASHSLPHLPEGHKCRRDHGHSYRVRVRLQAVFLNQDGFVRDYGDLTGIREFLDTVWDHQNLNALSLIGLAPTVTCAEKLAEFLFRRFKQTYPELVEVAVSETQKTWASYRDDLDALRSAEREAFRALNGEETVR